MRVLVTGDSGMIGRAVARRLDADGIEVAGFDLSRGQDLADSGALDEATRGCQAVVHLAALTNDDHPPPSIAKVNIAGTAAVLAAAARAGAERVVHMSSAQALGVFIGARPPDYLPLDDDHPTYATRPYALSKLAGEQLCALFTARSAIPSLSLRPPLVLDRSWRDAIAERMRATGGELRPWEYSAFIDAEDLAAAVAAALTAPLDGHRSLLVAGPDLCSESGRTAAELARALCPQAHWRGGEAYERHPYRALIDSAPARELLGWTPRRPWREDRDAGMAQ